MALQSATRAADVVVTVAGPTSGPHVERTQQMLAGAKAAAEDINRAGGIKGSHVRVALADDGCNEQQTNTIAAGLADTKVDLVIGHPCARSAVVAGKIYASRATLFIAIGSRYGSVARAVDSKTVFRLSGRDATLGYEAARYFHEHFKGQQIAVVHDRTRASIAIADDATAAIKKLGGVEPLSGTVVGGDKDFPLLIAKIKSAAAIFFVGYPLEAGMLMRQLRQAGATGAFLMSPSNGSDEFERTFGASAAGALVLRPRFGLSDGPESSEVRQSAADRALASAAIYAFASAGNAATSLNADAIASVLSMHGIKTPLGTVAFDETGEAARPSFDVYRWNGTVWEGALSEPTQ